MHTVSIKKTVPFVRRLWHSVFHTCRLCSSTVSTGLNSLAAIWWAELDGTALKKSASQHRSGLAVKFLALLFGLLSYALVYVVPYMGGLAPVSYHKS